MTGRRRSRLARRSARLGVLRGDARRQRRTPRNCGNSCLHPPDPSSTCSARRHRHPRFRTPGSARPNRAPQAQTFTAAFTKKQASQAPKRTRRGFRSRTISAAPHPRPAWPLWSESGRWGGVSDRGGGGARHGSERRVGAEVALSQDAECRRCTHRPRGGADQRDRVGRGSRMPDIGECQKSVLTQRTPPLRAGRKHEGAARLFDSLMTYYVSAMPPRLRHPALDTQQSASLRCRPPPVSAARSFL